MVVVEQLVPLAPSSPQLLLPVGREAFLALLGVLLRQEGWSKGLEWDVISLVEQIYSLLVPESLPGEANCAGINTQQYPRFPREALMSLGISAIIVENLEVRLREHKVNYLFVLKRTSYREKLLS